MQHPVELEGFQLAAANSIHRHDADLGVEGLIDRDLDEVADFLLDGPPGGDHGVPEGLQEEEGQH